MPTDDDPRDLLDKWLIEDILEMSGEEIREELRELGIDPDEAAARWRQRILDVIDQVDAKKAAARASILRALSSRMDDLIRACALQVWDNLNPGHEPPPCLLSGKDAK